MHFLNTHINDKYKNLKTIQKHIYIELIAINLAHCNFYRYKGQYPILDDANISVTSAIHLRGGS